MINRYHYLLVTLFFAAVICFLHGAVLLSPSQFVIAGQKVAGMHTWLYWWFHYALSHKIALFHTNLMMYPGGLDVYFHSPVNEIPAVLLQNFISPYSVTNILSLTSQILTGIASYVLFHDLTKEKIPALCGSFALVFGTYMLTQHAYGQTDSTQFFNPLFILAIQRRLRVPNYLNTLLLGLAFVGVCLSGPYIAYCFGFIFILGSVIFVLFQTDRKILRTEIGWFDVLVLVFSVSVVGLFYWPILRNMGHWLGGDSRIYSCLASFVSVPFWHSSPLLQRLRIAGFGPENSFGYLGLGVTCLIFLGLFKKLAGTIPSFRFWLWIFCWCALLSLGPWLILKPGVQIPFPLPYYLFEKIPGLLEFRSVSRIWMTGSLAACALAAITIKSVLTGKSFLARVAFLAGFLALIGMEFDLPQISKWFVSAKPSAAYVFIKNDPGNFAILDLPQAYVKGIGFSNSGNYYMLFQPFHQKPMVFGSPSRCTNSSLEFTNRTPFVYELLHPWTLSSWERSPSSKVRLNRYINKGINVLTVNKIKYVLFHGNSQAVREDVKHHLERWLNYSLGRPVLIDTENIRLYKIFN